MKKILLLVLFISATTCFAQDAVELKFKAKDAKTIYQAKSEVGLHKPKAELYAAAKQWVADYFKTPKSLILNEDLVAGILYGKGYIFVNADEKSKTYKMGLTMQIDCKDNHYKIRLYDVQFIEHTTPKGGRSVYSLFTPDDLAALVNNGDKTKTISPKVANRLLQNFGKDLHLTMESFVKAMGTK